MTTAHVLDTISRLPGMIGEASDAVSSYTVVRVVLPTLLGKEHRSKRLGHNSRRSRISCKYQVENVSTFIEKPISSQVCLIGRHTNGGSKSLLRFEVVYLIHHATDQSGLCGLHTKRTRHQRRIC